MLKSELMRKELRVRRLKTREATTDVGEGVVWRLKHKTRTILSKRSVWDQNTRFFLRMGRMQMHYIGVDGLKKRAVDDFCTAE